MTSFFQLIRLLQAGFILVRLPGLPVGLIPFQDGYAVACTCPASLCFIRGGIAVEDPSFAMSDPAGIALWNGSPAVSDRGGNSVVTSDTVYNLPGSPEGVCQVFWNGDTESQLAVCLFDKGQVILLHSDGATEFIADVPGAKDVIAADPDGDGDQDLFVSSCGTGLVLVINHEAGPLVQRLGNIGCGVKRLCLCDMNGDDLPDVAGISCAEGGVGWWRNPGIPEGPWEYFELDGLLQGPKDLAAAGSDLLAVSIFSPVFSTFEQEHDLPGGLTCCHLDSSERLVLGHSAGFIALGEMLEPTEH